MVIKQERLTNHEAEPKTQMAADERTLADEEDSARQNGVLPKARPKPAAQQGHKGKKNRRTRGNPQRQAARAEPTGRESRVALSTKQTTHCQIPLRVRFIEKKHAPKISGNNPV